MQTNCAIRAQILLIQSYAAEAPKHKNAEHAGEIVDLIHMRNFARVATGVALLNYA